jgi:hypothetical protein
MFDEETMKGFLIDWDYAEFTSNGLKNFQSWFEDRAKDVNYLDSLKELTVHIHLHTLRSSIDSC